MTTERINKLLQRYDDSTATESEETTLRQLAALRQLPSDWNDYFSALDEAVEVPDGMEQRLVKRIDAMQAAEKLNRRQWWRRVTGIAATVAILLTIGLYVHNQRQTQVLLEQDTYTDPQEAYNKTEQVLTLLSRELNKGDEGMQALEFMTQKLNKK